ncbi:MAG: hypothetical protein AAFQ98_25635, partial [Bacteroidota bacterium]
MRLRILLLGLLYGSSFLFSFPSFSQTSLSPGDVAFLGFSASNNPSHFSFLLLEDITANTEIIFTDRGWDGSQLVEHPLDTLLVWTSDTAMEAGAVVTVSGSSANMGTLLGNFEQYFFSHDQIYALQGSVDAPSFLAAINTKNWVVVGEIDTNAEGLLPDVLATDQRALSFDILFGQAWYAGRVANGTKSELREEIYTPTNWDQSTYQHDELPVQYSEFTVGSAFTDPGTTLQAGDIAMVGVYYSDVQARFAFTLLEPVVAGTQLVITDHGWLDTAWQFIPQADQLHTWEATENLPAGTVVMVEGKEVNVGAWYGGEIQFDNQEQLYFFQGRTSAPRFLTAFSATDYIVGSSNNWHQQSIYGLLPASLAANPAHHFYIDAGNSVFTSYLYAGPLKAGTKQELLAELYFEPNIQTRTLVSGWRKKLPSSFLVGPAWQPTGTVLQPSDEHLTGL